MKTSLIVLAAGMGSRFGGAKQLHTLTADGKTLLDFSIEDAKNIGFDQVVFVIRREIDGEFKQSVGKRAIGFERVDYVYQSHDVAGRTKPLGTAQAILQCKEIVKNSFAVINADDYYGYDALKLAYDFLQSAHSYGMVGYKLGKVLSKGGNVTRGLCKVEKGNLLSIEEKFQITPDGVDASGQRLPLDSIVSMNLWAFTPQIFAQLQMEFEHFTANANLLVEEFLLPTVVGKLLSRKEAQVKVLPCNDPCVGMTFREDLPAILDYLQSIGRL